MSISTPAGDQRGPSTVSTGKKPPAGAKPAAKAGGGKPSGGGRPSGGGKPAAKAGARPAAKAGGSGGGAGKAGGGKGPRKPITPVRVSQGRNWGPIAMFVAVGVLAVGIIGYGAWAAFQGSKPWEDQASGIDGIVNYREKDPALMEGGKHQQGKIEYTVLPPVAGPHNQDWQNCMGDVYDAPIANEHAVHSMEHGAVWVTYKSGLAADQVEKLASKVRGNEFMLMSPIDNLDANVSLQAWGYQLKLDNADDGRIDDFIKALRQNATMEPGAACSGGITATGTTPRDLSSQQTGS